MPQDESLKENAEVLFETRSVEVQEIIGRVPHWIMRWGISVIGMVLLFLVLISYFIRYPNKISSNVVITSSNPPVKIIAQTSGRIKQLLVKQHDSVNKGSMLLIIENNADYSDVLNAGTIAKRFYSSTEYNEQDFNAVTSNYRLGELQGFFDLLLANINSYSYYLRNNQNGLKLQHLTRQLSQAQTLTKQLEKNSTKVKESFEIDKRKYETDTLLFSKGVITKTDFLNSKKSWLNQEMSLEVNTNKIMSSQLAEEQLQKELIDSKKTFDKEKYELEQAIRSSAKEFLLQSQNWDQKFIVRSPISGRVNLFSVWKESQWVNNGEGIMMVTPSYEFTVAKGTIPIRSSGKLKIGQKVMLNLISHPSAQYGHINGIVSFVSAVPMDSVYSFDIELPNGLLTSAGKKIDSKPQLFAEGEIITEDKNLASILLESFLGSK